MTGSDPLDQLVRAAELRRQLEGLSRDQVELRLQQNEDLRELVEPLLAGPDEAEATTERTIGDFRLIREIGRGGMGIVYEAWQSSLNRRVALKLLSQALGSDPASVARFHREATLAAGLSHPSLASVHGFHASADGHCLVMEYVEGVPCDQLVAAVSKHGLEHDPSTAVAELGVRIRERGYEAFVARAVAEVAEALHHAHGAGVIHRDVKPANLILRDNGRAVLTDFGLAREAGREGVTVTGELTGTPAYQSPEQVGLASVELGPLTDVFSLGVTLYELLTGRKPFDGDTVLEIQEAILRRRVPDPLRINPRIPRDLLLVLRKAMHKHPGDRYPTAGAMAEDLRRFAAAETVHARPLPPLLRLRRWCSQNPLLAAFHAVTVVAAVLIAVSWWRVESALTDFRWLAAGVRVDALLQAFDEAPPAWPEHMPQYREWVDEAELLRGWLPQFRERVARLRALGTEDNNGNLRFASVEQQFLYDGNVRNLEELREVDRRVLPGLREQLQWAEKIERLTVLNHDEIWRQVAAFVAADPRFGGFVLRPQLGLVPLRMDPVTRLWEFAHLRSGDLPKPDDRGRWIVAGDTAIVFVLVPPVTFAMGCQGESRELPNYDENARERDGPVHDVAIEWPFFLSKYELSRGQWRRLGGEPRITDARDTHDDVDLERYPLVGQSHDDVTRLLRRFGLELPTESQWEASCRAGSGREWTCGSRVEEVVAFANLRDQDLFDERGAVNPPKSPAYAPARDGFARQAPVGALAPNAWGFHQMHGNVDELCRDGLGSGYHVEPRAIDGLREVRSTARVVRGGTYLRDVFKTGSGIRNGVPPGARLRSIGARPVRAVRN